MKHITQAQVLLAVIEDGSRYSIDDLAFHLGAPTPSVRRAIHTLRNSGFLINTERNSGGTYYRYVAR